MDKKKNNDEPYKRNINTPDREAQEERKDVNAPVENEESREKEQKKKHSSAAEIDAIISSPTANVHARHKTQSWGNTGTNISYEEQTAPGGMGSVGTGQASGQDATGASIHTPDADNVKQVHKDEEDTDRTKNTDEERKEK